MDPSLFRRAVTKNVILSTHIVSDVSYIANYILMMRGGRFLLGEPMETVTDPIKGKVWENRYREGWEIYMSSFELLMFALLAVCIVIAPVFSGEYQAGTDAVILSGKYGKTKLVTAKITSSMLSGVLAFTLHIAAAFGPLLAGLGFKKRQAV